MTQNNILIRSLNEYDFCELNNIRTQEGVFENLLSVQTETLSETESYFLSDINRKYTFVAEKTIDDKPIVVGYVRLIQDKDVRKRHKGRISIAIHQDFQKEGIGNQLFIKITEFSRDWLLLKKLELTVLEKNKQAVKLYEKHGFKIEGHLKKDTIVSGKYEDVYYMSLFL